MDSQGAKHQRQREAGRETRRLVLQSRQLFGMTNEVLIQHAGCTYRLRITQGNKLILTK